MGIWKWVTPELQFSWEKWYIIYNPLVRVLWGIPFSSLNPNEKQGRWNLFFGPRNHRLEVTVLKVINDILIRLMRAMVKTWLLLACGPQYQHFVSSPRKAQFQICHPYKSGESTGCLVVPTLGDGNQPISRDFTYPLWHWQDIFLDPINSTIFLEPKIGSAKPKATPGTSTFWRLSLAWLRWWWCCWPNGQRRWPPLINAGCPAVGFGFVEMWPLLWVASTSTFFWAFKIWLFWEQVIPPDFAPDVVILSVDHHHPSPGCPHGQRCLCDLLRLRAHHGLSGLEGQVAISAGHWERTCQSV